MPTGTRRKRRSVAELVTEEGIDRLRRRVRGFSRQMETSVPPPTDAREQARRQKAISEGVTRVFGGACLYLQEHHPAVARALVTAGREYIEQALRDETPRFVVKRVTRQHTPAWLLYPVLLANHHFILEALKRTWRAPVDEAQLAIEHHFVSRRGRYGTPQARGNRRRAAQRRQRIPAVFDILEAVAKSAELETPCITDAQIRRWITADRTPARLSYRILGALLGKSPRVIKKMLDDAGRYMRQAGDRHKTLDLWKLGHDGPISVKPPAPEPAPQPVTHSKR